MNNEKNEDQLVTPVPGSISSTRLGHFMESAIAYLKEHS